MRTIFNLLPNDVQQMLLTNPQRAGLLKAVQEVSKVPAKSPLKSPSRFALFRQMIEAPLSEVKSSGEPSRQKELLQDPLDLNRT